MSHTDDSQPLLGRQYELPAGAKRFWHGFSDFALRDNVLEVALGLIVAASFTTVVTSFTSEILLPFVALLPFVDKQLEEKFAVLRGGPEHGSGYNTLKQAIDDGAIVLAYGSFLDKVVSFLGMGLSLYLIARVYGWVANDPSIIHETVKCKYCRKRISVKAKRCVNCTSWLDGRES